MKVETDLRAGSIFADAADNVNQVAGQVTSFIKNADQEAKDLVDALTKNAGTMWDSVTGIFNRN